MDRNRPFPLRFRLLLTTLLLLAVGGADAQDVFVGGRLDLELSGDPEITFDFGRLAGVDITLQEPGILDAYLDLSVAGGDARIQEFYISPPQTRRYVDLLVGRFLLPYGDPQTDPIDRYVDGGRDLFDPYADWRRGNVYLDTDVTGLQLHRRLGWFEGNAVAAATPDGDLCGQGRLLAHLGGGRLGGSVFYGQDTNGAQMRQGALHAGWSGGGLEAQAQWYVGAATGGDHRGILWRAAYTPPKFPLTGFVSQTLFNDDTQRAQMTTRFGVGWRFSQRYRVEGRYEVTDALAPFDDNRWVVRGVAVF